MNITVRNVSKTFGEFTALRNVSLDIPEGELVALLGPSGSGKTTLLRIIAGLESPDDGGDSAVLFGGEDISRKSAGERKVGFVFQHYALFRSMTVAQNVAFGLEVRPRSTRPSKENIRAKVDELLELIQLRTLANRFPSQLSGGQRQRVALARALAIEPKVLLLDEPFGALDAKVRQGLRRWLRRLHDELHVTSVLVTHDQEEALEVADRVVVMNHAEIEQEGTPDEVFHHPKTEFVMNFLGNVNLFSGRIEAGGSVVSKAIIPPAIMNGDYHPELAGRAAKVMVRPHDIDVEPAEDGKPGLRATVLRVQSAGPLVKLELQGEAGESIHVEMSHERFRATGIRQADTLIVGIRGGKVFAANNPEALQTNAVV